MPVLMLFSPVAALGAAFLIHFTAAFSPHLPPIDGVTPRPASTPLRLRIVDEDATLAQSKFPIPPADLIRRCQEVIDANLGTDDPERFLSPSFEFVGPTDGPIGQAKYARMTGPVLRAIKDSFPDVETNYYNFRVDPFEPNRVWYNTRATATMTEPLVVGGSTFDPNGEAILQAPQAASMSFDTAGMVTELTAGFSLDRRSGNTSGLTAVYAVFRHAGLELPFPEAKPWRPSLPLRLFQEVTSLLDKERDEGDILWWRKEEADRLHSKPVNEWSVPPIHRET